MLKLKESVLLSFMPAVSIFWITTNQACWLQSTGQPPHPAGRRSFLDKSERWPGRESIWVPSHLVMSTDAKSVIWSSSHFPLKLHYSSCCPRQRPLTPLSGVPKTLIQVREDKMVFMILPRCHLPFSLILYHNSAVEFWCTLREEPLKLYEKTFKNTPHFSNYIFVWGQIFSSYLDQNNKCRSRWESSRESSKSDLKGRSKHIKQCHSLH